MKVTLSLPGSPTHSLPLLDDWLQLGVVVATVCFSFFPIFLSSNLTKVLTSSLLLSHCVILFESRHVLHLVLSIFTWLFSLLISSVIFAFSLLVLTPVTPALINVSFRYECGEEPSDVPPVNADGCTISVLMRNTKNPY